MGKFIFSPKYQEYFVNQQKEGSDEYLQKIMRFLALNPSPSNKGSSSEHYRRGKRSHKKNSTL